MDRTTKNLADYTLSTQYDALPPETVVACKDRILDTLGCMAGAYGHPVSEAAVQLAGRYRMDTPATIFCNGDSTAPDMAAFANGVMLRVLDMSDTYRVKSGGHPSDIMAACFAAAEVAGADGKELIAAIATAYEVYCACCDAVDLNTIGWDQPVYGVVASALGAGKLLGLAREQLGDAIALALVPNMAMYQTRKGELSAWKGCAGANAARNGVFAALLAQSGLTGPEQPVEGDSGLWELVGRFDWALTPGEPPYRIAHTHLKCFPICFHGQSAVWAALGLRDRLRVDDIESVEIATYHTALRQMAGDATRWSPKTRETADHSLPYVVGAALLDGPVGEAAFSDEALRKPELGALMQRISVVEDDGLTASKPDESPSRVTVHLKDGSELRNEMPNPKGHDRNPMTSDEVRDKFRGLFEIYGDASQAEGVIAAVDTLDRAGDIGPLVESFARKPG